MVLAWHCCLFVFALGTGGEKPEDDDISGWCTVGHPKRVGPGYSSGWWLGAVAGVLGLAHSKVAALP